jgi:putative methionine-R-sulfoxide reductase with GAF domain
MPCFPTIASRPWCAKHWELALDVLRAEGGTVYLHDPDTDTLVFRYVVGPMADIYTGQRMPANKGIAGKVFQSGEPDLASDVSRRDEHNRALDEKSGYRTQSTMTVPMKRPDGTPIGVMQILNARPESDGRSRQFDEGDLEVLQVLCGQAAAAIEQARLQEEARRAEIVNVIGDISHDIKNMLTPIQSGVWTLGPMLDQLFEDLDTIRAICPDTEPWGRDIERIANNVRDDYRWMLDGALDSAAKVQARTAEIADAIKGEVAPPFFEEADLNETARGVIETLRLVGERGGVHLKLDPDPDLPRAQFDRNKMDTALYNLVNNAIPETPSGGSITIRTRGPSTGRGHAACRGAGHGQGHSRAHPQAPVHPGARARGFRFHQAGRHGPWHAHRGRRGPAPQRHHHRCQRTGPGYDVFHSPAASPGSRPQQRRNANAQSGLTAGRKRAQAAFGGSGGGVPAPLLGA